MASKLNFQLEPRIDNNHRMAAFLSYADKLREKVMRRCNSAKSDSCSTSNVPQSEQLQNCFPSEVAENKEDIRLIWLDANMNDTSNFNTKKKLRELNPAALFYSDFDRCADFIKSVKDDLILLIVSDALATRVLSEIHDYRALIAIFIFCSDPAKYQSIMKKKKKIFEIFTGLDSLLKSIPNTMDLIIKQTSTFRLFDEEQKFGRDLSKESASFLWNQMLFNILNQMPQNEESKNEMLNICRDYYQRDTRELQKIGEFQKSYIQGKGDAIEWYTDHCFLYKLLNKALRTENIDLIYIFRFFIIDLCAELKRKSGKLKNAGILKLYRGTKMTTDELKKMTENIGKLISANGFFSTSKSENKAREFMEGRSISKDNRRVLLKIEADPSLETVFFADIEEYSRNKEEKEVLFNINSVFKIGDVIDMDSESTVTLIATDEGSKKVKEYQKLAAQQSEQYTPTINFGRLLLYDMGQIDRASKYFDMLLKLLPPNHSKKDVSHFGSSNTADPSDIASVYKHIGAVHRRRGEYNLALNNVEIAYEIARKRLPSDDPHIAGLLHNFGTLYKKNGNLDEALDYYQQALDIQSKIYSNNNLDKAMILQNIGTVYARKNDSVTALNYLEQSRTMFERVLMTKEHSRIAECLGQIGYVYKKKGDFDLALKYYRQQLEMEETCLPSNHPILSFHLSWIVDIYKKIGGTEEALEFCQEELNNQKQKFGNRHLRIAQTLMIMADIIKNNDLDKVLEYYQQALSILDEFKPADHQTKSKCLTSIACLYENHDMFTDALQYELQALDLCRQTLPASDINIAHRLNNIGKYYEKLNNPSKALRYFNESLLIYRAKLDNESVKKVEANIVKLNQKQTSIANIKST